MPDSEFSPQQVDQGRRSGAVPAGPAASLVLCEARGQFAGQVRHRAPDLRPRLCEVRSGQHLRQALVAAPASLVWWELQGELLAQWLRAMPGLERDFPHMRWLALCPGPLEAPLAQALRQWGALAVLRRPWALEAGLRLARRHCQRWPAPENRQRWRVPDLLPRAWKQ